MNNKEILKELSENKIKIDDKVKIKNCNLSYTTYANWIEKNIDKETLDYRN